MSKKIKVFYDGKCNICKREINFYSKIDKDKNFDWINIHNNKKKINVAGRIRLNKWKGKSNIDFVVEDISLN